MDWNRKMNIGNKIKELRLKANITQEALATEMGVSCQSVSKWENNVCAPDISLLPSLSEFFGVTIDELFDLSTEQKLTRIENMYEYEAELSDAKYRETEKFLLGLLPAYDKKNPDKEAGRIESLLGHLYHHRIMSESKKVSDFARRAMRINPGIKRDQWLLNESENAVMTDWNCANHSKTIDFYMELVTNHPEIERNYLYLLDNLLADHRTVEARQYLETYKRLENYREFNVNIYSARIELAEFNLPAAKAILEKMEKESGDDPATVFELAGAYAALCEYDRAVSFYEKSYEMDEKPRFYDALWGIATIYEIQKKYDKAIETWERIKLNLNEEWNTFEGAAIDNANEEIKRIQALMK